jgi:hypothetical protein
MTHLLDVNLLLACAWESHGHHVAARTWLERQKSFATCPISQLGFLRVSLSPGFRATHADALAALRDIIDRKQALFLPDDAAPAGLPAVSHHADMTDAYLVTLARAHGCRLATLDEALCTKAWAKDIAVNPLPRNIRSRTD